jgi:Transglycosylase-like domain
VVHATASLGAKEALVAPEDWRSSLNRKVLASAITAGVLSAPVAIAVADENDTSNVIPTPAGEAAQLDKEQLNTVALKRKATRYELRHEAKAERKAKAKKRAKKRAKLAKKQAAQGQVAAAPQQQAAGGGTATPGHLAAIAACESGGNPSAVGGGGAYRGKYQFDQQTWASVGGSGDPAAAPEAEQDKRAAMLYAKAGSSPWPVCGG